MLLVFGINLDAETYFAELYAVEEKSKEENNIMAKPDPNRNTDVPATIAGFYYQVIIACREICREHVKEVGVETGADVVVIDDNSKKICIEAKLHSKKFNCFSDDVIKTIYNFYNDYKKTASIEQMIFTTNVGIVDNDKTLFDMWGTTNVREIEYIKKAVLIKSVEVHPECKKNYKKFCANLTETKNECLKKILLEEVFEKKISCYADYAVENDECTYQSFIQKLQFQFCNKGKNEILKEIEEETEKKIAKDYLVMSENTQHKILSEEGTKIIFSKLVKMFFDYIVENSQTGTKRNISVVEYHKCLSDYYKNEKISEELKNAERVKCCLEMLAYDEEEFLEELDLEKEEDREYQECYAKVKQLFLSKLQEKKGNLDFMKRYLLKESMKSQEKEIIATIIELLKMLAVILYEEEISVENIKLFFDNDLNNLEITGKLQCCYKRAYGKTNITNIIRNMREKLEIQKGNGQIIVAEAHYQRSGRPCEIEKLLPEVYDFTQIDENCKDYIYLGSFNYKCSDCIVRNSDDYKDFWKGGGGLCKEI